MTMKILIPTDGSDNSNIALKYGIYIAPKFDATITDPGDRTRIVKNSDVVDFDMTLIKAKHVYGIICASGFNLEDWKTKNEPNYTEIVKYYHANQNELNSCWTRN